MKVLRISQLACLALLLSSSAFAQEARPWLCRDKPVFSYERPMQYQASVNSGREWQMFFMQYSPDAAHDGFEIIDSRRIPAAGTLSAGQYYAVALYRQGGHWICPGYTHDDHNPRLGEVSNLCYGEDGPPCLVKLLVKGNQPPAPAPAPAP